MIDRIEDSYRNVECRVLHPNQLTDPFTVDTRVRQGRILSPMMFSYAMDWLMRNVTRDKRQGIQWTVTPVLEDLHFALTSDYYLKDTKITKKTKDPCEDEH
ncbi:hypothetical protein PoB_002703700 [Plakobranchus ocellatus]|uniref:Reverse transcriptase domain-containing protein n=1 Tax=Plakobranchus ocellatus TaxID=259542 RepID=A0AAV3ZZS3_9GAST|nr:hypothetical protein PoB_002703700 [Plakobranchus ocellatus]